VDAIHELYKKAPSRPKETFLFLNYLGKDNLLFQHGPLVKQMRLRYNKMVSTPEALESIHKISALRFTNAADKWDRGPIDLFEELSHLVYDIMGEALFGSSWLSSSEGREIYRNHTYLIKNSLRWAFYPVSPYWNADYREYLACIKRLRDICSKLINKRRQAIESDPGHFVDDRTALTMLILEKDEEGKLFFSHERAISTLIGFLNGAYDTTHSTLYWLFFNLAKNQDVQLKLTEQIQDRFGRRFVPTLEELRDVPYLHAVLQESMRVRCTVPMNQRVNLTEDITIQGRLVPKGVCMSIPMFITMRDEHHFGPETHHFVPERFMGDGAEAKKARRANMAFGEQQRMCVGFTFAMVELKVAVVTVLQKYQVTLENMDDAGECFAEAGVNQPKNPSVFLFTRHPSVSLTTN